MHYGNPGNVRGSFVSSIFVGQPNSCPEDMQSKHKTLHTAFGLLALAVSFVTYLLTVQPTVPFWDCGEFTAAAVGQQVPHPPGAPLFLMVGKLFHLLPFGDPGWRVNLVSVVSSAITVWLLYLITVRVIRNFYKGDLDEFGNAVMVYGSALVGALAFTYTDTQWFNAVESEVYAASSLFVALITWLMMVWNEHADDVGSEKYLLLIAYLIGLSIGVHLLSILTVFSLALLVYLRKYKQSFMGTVVTGAIGVAAFAAIYYGVILRFPALLAGNLPIKNEASEWVSEGGLYTFLGIALIAVAIYGVIYGRRTKHGVLAMSSSAFLLLVLGYSTYGHILVRSNSNPPMNENKPENLTKLVSYLGREQYGEAPNWPRRYQSEERFVRNYRKYGPWTPPPYVEVTKKDGTRSRKPDYGAWKLPASAEFGYMWDYQIRHMYIRYFMWNFMGRMSDVQDAWSYSPIHVSAHEVEEWNHKSGYGDLFPINFWMLPFLIGFLGLIFHFVRDWKMASVFFIMFLMTGVLAAIQQNQQNPQPRERDYFYVSSFMVYAMWIGIGAFAIAERLRANAPAMMASLAALILVVPVNMAAQGWKMHSRAGNYLAFDYAYNILQSAERNAIIFTNGDNDTFPVWYLQDVAGVRRDVRLVNLSLGQTTWYIEQLKNREPHGAQRVPLSFSDESLNVAEDDPRALSYDFGPEREVVIDVDPAILAKFTTDQNIINSGKMRWSFRGTMMRQAQGREPATYLIGVQHKLVLDILQQTKFTRPVYFSTSVGDPSWASEYIGLDDYLRLEGMCFRVCPAPQRSMIGEGINEDVMDKTLFGARNGDDFSTDFAYGMKFRNLNNPAVYYDDVHRGYLMNYRNVFMKYANWLLFDKKDTTKAAKVMALMNDYISPDQFPMGMALEYRIASFFDLAGDRKHADAMAARLLASAEKLIAKPNLRTWEPQYEQNLVPERLAAEACAIMGRWDQAASYYRRFAQGQKNLFIDYLIDELQITKKERAGDVRGALDVARGLQSKYTMTDASQDGQSAAMELGKKISELERRLGIAPQPVALAPMPQ